jgi:hypothetical protein
MGGDKSTVSRQITSYRKTGDSMLNRTKQRLVARRLAARAGYEATARNRVTSPITEAIQKSMEDVHAYLHGLPDRTRLLCAAHMAGNAIALEVCENVVLGRTFIHRSDDESGYNYGGQSNSHSLGDLTTEDGDAFATATRLLIWMSGRIIQELILGDRLAYVDAHAWMTDYGSAYMDGSHYFMRHGDANQQESCQASVSAVGRAEKMTTELLGANCIAVFAVTKILYDTEEVSAEVVRQVVDSAGRVSAARWQDELGRELVGLSASIRQQKGAE